MRSNEHVQYRSCFRIKSTRDKTLGAVRRIIFDWLRTKEPEGITPEDYEVFKKRWEVSSMPGTLSRITTDHCFNGSDISWAMRYEHRDSEHRGKRFWYTDVGLRIYYDELIVATTISYAFNDTDITGDLPAPPANVPNFVRSIFANKDLGKKYVQIEGNVIQDKPIVFKTAKQAAGLTGLLEKPERQYAWVVASGDTTEVTMAAESLAYALAGKAQVIHLSGAASECAERDFPAEWQVRQGFLRVFFPVTKGKLVQSRNRWFEIGTPEFTQQRLNIINGLLRNLPAYEQKAVWSVGDVRSLLNHVAMTKRIAELSKGGGGKASSESVSELIKRNAELEGMLETAINDGGEQRTIANSLAVDIDILDADNKRLQSKCQQLEHAAKLASGRLTADEIVSNQLKFPESLHELCELFAKLYGSRLLFLPDSLRETKGYDAFENLPKAWDMLNSLAFTLYDMRFSETDGMSGEWNKRFQERTGIELAISEGKQTKADPALMRLRKVYHEGKEYDILPHIKWGTREPKILRIHYDFDAELQKVVIGYVGPHMKNYTSKQM